VAEFSFDIGERVRLIDDFQGITKGTEGVVFGFYRDDPPRYAVGFDGPARQVPPEYLETAEPAQS
jgi:hypothetical protein